MLIFRNEFTVRARVEDVFDFHADLDNLKRISPEDTEIDIIRADTPLSLGSEVHLRVKDRLLNNVWKLVITEFEPPHRFVDKQISGVFKAWIHEHSFEALSETESRVLDTVRYELPLGFLGRIFGRGTAERRLAEMFSHREKMTKRLLEDR